MTSKVPLTRNDIFALISGEANKMRSPDVWAVYSRKSRIDPRNPGYSMEIQPERAEEYARANGAKEIKLFDDPGRSGKNSKREGLQQLIYAVKSGQIDVVVFHRIDRVFRNLESLLEFVSLLKKYNVRFVSVTEQIDTDSWWGRLVLAVLGSLAEAYVWQASDRTREGLAERRTRGLHVGSLPLGYCRGLCSTCNDVNGQGYCPLYGNADRLESKSGKLAVPHPVDRHVIPMIFNSYLQGMSLREIANLLNDHRSSLPDGSSIQFRSRRKNSRKSMVNEPRFNRESIRAILENPFYAGQVARYRRPKFSLEDDLEHPENIPTPKVIGNSREVLELFQGQHEALITFETWQAALSARKGKANTPSTQSRSVRVYPLSGVARCWECFEASGQEFTLRGTASGKGYSYYRCAYVHDQALKRKPKVASRIAGINPVARALDQKLLRQHKLLQAAKIEEQVDRLIARLVIPAGWNDWIVAYYLSEDGMAAFERAGYQHRQELQKLKDLYMAGHLSGPDFERQTRTLQNNLASLQPASKPEAQPILDELRLFVNVWKVMSNTEKRVLLDTIFAGLYFDRNGDLIRAVAYEPFDKLLDLPQDGMLGGQ